MITALPRPHEARQLLRLRSLRVQKAQEACQRARAEADLAMDAVQRRQRDIAATRAEADALGAAIVHQLAPDLPRWGGFVAAQRERLAERLERAEFELIGDEQALEEARERVEQTHGELTRALARDDAVRRLADEARSTQSRATEQRHERELDDAARRPTAA